MIKESMSTMATNAALEQMNETLVNTLEAMDKVDKLESRYRVLQELSGHNASLDVRDLVQLDRAHQHLLWMDIISKVSNLVSEVTAAKKKRKVKDPYGTIVSCHRLLVAIVESLVTSSCPNLRDYSVRVLVYLRANWIDQLESDLTADLTVLNFPQCVLAIERGPLFLGEDSPAGDVSNVSRFQTRYRALADLRLPEAVKKHLDEEDCDPALVVLKPIKKRFKYHFCGTKKTNNPIKPEWYLQQAGVWLKNSQQFFNVCVRPVRGLYEHSFPGYERFCEGLFALVVKKLHKDIVDVMYDDVTLSHVIDEVLIFSREVASCTIPGNQLPLAVLCDPTIFNRWIALERKFAFAKIDDITLEEGSWTACDSRTDVSNCTETFVVLLQSITNRYKFLANVENQLKFVELQCELLEDMRLRFAQILRQEQAFPLSEKFCLILSSSQHLIDILYSWSEITLFLQLEYAKSGNDNSNLFGDIIERFDFLVNDLMRTLADHIFYEVKALSKAYRKDVKWFSYSLPSVDEDECVDPCSESFPMFQTLAAHLEFIGKWLPSCLMSKVVTGVCEQMSDFLIRDVVLENKFSTDGCRQFQVDTEKRMMAIFSQYALDSKGESFKQLKDVSLLLNTKQATAVLLLDTLQDSLHQSCVKDVLEEVHIYCLTGEQAVKVLRQRIDVK